MRSDVHSIRHMDILQDNFFGHAMFMLIEATIDWNWIKQQKQEAICTSNEQEI